MSQQTRVEAIAPVRLAGGAIHYAPALIAGDWVFATGHMAHDYGAGVPESVLARGHPHRDRPKREKEAARIFDQLEGVLERAGASLSTTLRLDQYYTSKDAVDHYHVERKRRLTSHIPPSTSVLINDLPLTDAEMVVELIAATKNGALCPQPIHQAVQNVHPSSAYSAALRAGDFLFLAGAVASPLAGHPARDSLAEAAQIPDGAQWKGSSIALEAEYLLTQKFAVLFEECGIRLQDIVKAQVYLNDSEDTSRFNEVWRKHFGEDIPVTTIVPLAAPGINTRAARLEINLIALHPLGSTVREVLRTPEPTAYAGYPAGVRAGDLLLLSGLMAVNEGGLVPAARLDPRAPFYVESAERQAEAILLNAAAICEAAGASLKNVVRVQQFHTELCDIPAVARAWDAAVGDQPLPFSAVQVPRLPVPGARLLMDLWVYAP